MEEEETSIWDAWILKCPKCLSKNVRPLKLYKFTFTKKKREVQKYKCLDCDYEFWD